MLPKYGYLGDPTSPFYQSLLPQKGSFSLTDGYFSKLQSNGQK